MKRVLTALVLIPLVLALVFKGPLWLVAIVVYFFIVVGVREYLDLVDRYQVRVPRALVWVIVGLTGAITIAASASEHETRLSMMVVGLLFLAPYLVLIASFRRPVQESVPSGALGSLVFPWVVVPMLLLVVYRGGDNGWFLVLYLLIVVWSGDIFAYYFGRAFGRHRLAPEISPKKSWEGAIASVVSSSILAGVLTYSAPQLSTWLREYALLNETTSDFPRVWAASLGAVVINVAAQFGDLAESLLKRGAGVKDSGTLLPGHGGVLDRIDALLFASPVAGVLFFLWAIYD